MILYHYTSIDALYSIVKGIENKHLTMLATPAWKMRSIGHFAG